jgi:hypothetical protein
MSIHADIQINCATIQQMTDSIVKLQYKPDYEIELSDVKEVEQVFMEIFESEPIHCLMDLTGQYNNITKEAQNYLSKDAIIVKTGQLKSSAVVIDNLPNRLMARFFLKFFRPTFAMKIFAHQNEAFQWLQKRVVEEVKEKSILE